MKTLLIKLLPAVIFIVLVASCKKENFIEGPLNSVVTDYRLAFVGDYHFTRYSSIWIYTQGSSDTTIYFDGTINLGSTDSTVIIPTSPDDEIEIVVRENGEFGNCVECSQYPHYSRSGNFYADSVKLNIGYNGLGSIWHWKITGEKY